jgi:outer membrane protein assembly factor BamD
MNQAAYSLSSRSPGSANNRKNHGVALLVAALCVFVIGGCGAFNPSKDPTADWTVEKLYAEARSELDSGNNVAAVKLYEKLESRYPFSRHSQQAQLDTAYAHYRDNDPTLSLAAIDRFLRLYPDHTATDYALYLKGLVNFNENQGLFTSIGGQDLSERDQQAFRDAFDSLRQLIERFPNSRYAADSRLRLSWLINQMAAGDIHIARHYLRRGAFLAAANRAQGVVRQYPQAQAVEDALAMMVLAYDRLGLNDLRDDAKRILNNNFPGSRKVETVMSDEVRTKWTQWAFW